MGFWVGGYGGFEAIVPTYEQYIISGVSLAPAYTVAGADIGTDYTISGMDISKELTISSEGIGA